MGVGFVEIDRDSAQLSADPGDACCLEDQAGEVALGAVLDDVDVSGPCALKLTNSRPDYLGIGVAVLLFLIFPVVVGPYSLVAATGLPLLGAITLNQQPEEKRGELYGLLTLGVLSVCLLLTFVGVSLGQGNLFA